MCSSSSRLSAPRLGERVVRLEDGEAELASRTIARRLSSVSGLFAYLAAHQLGQRGKARVDFGAFAQLTRGRDSS
jgi:hypothetical protein